MAIDIEKIKNQAKPKTEVDSKEFSFEKLYKKFQTIGTVTSKDKIFFVQNLQVMIRRGLPWDKSLKTLDDQTRNGRFQKIINDLAQDTEKGVSFIPCRFCTKNIL